MKEYLDASITVALSFILALAITLAIALVVNTSPSQDDSRVFILLEEPAEGAFGKGVYMEYAIDGHIYGTTVLYEKYDDFIHYLKSIAKE